MSESTDQLFVLPPCHEPVSLVREARSYLVVEKPAGLLSVPGRSPKNRDCVISRLQLEYPQATAAHRLDFDTSGLMLVPVTRAALSHLSRQFQQRTVRKRYEALVFGQVERDQGRIELPIAPDPEHRPKSKITPDGKPSITDYRVLERDEFTNTTRLALWPVTGRSHQLRLHLQAIGHPILGCGFYAHAEALDKADRLLLHACALSYTDPDTGHESTVESAVPF